MNVHNLADSLSSRGLKVAELAKSFGLPWQFPESLRGFRYELPSISIVEFKKSHCSKGLVLIRL